jgi:hypothetical protein
LQEELDQSKNELTALQTANAASATEEKTREFNDLQQANQQEMARLQEIIDQKQLELAKEKIKKEGYSISSIADLSKKDTDIQNSITTSYPDITMDAYKKFTKSKTNQTSSNFDVKDMDDASRLYLACKKPEECKKLADNLIEEQDKLIKKTGFSNFDALNTLKNISPDIKKEVNYIIINYFKDKPAIINLANEIETEKANKTATDTTKLEELKQKYNEAISDIVLNIVTKFGKYFKGAEKLEPINKELKTYRHEIKDENNDYTLKSLINDNEQIFL